jgi:UDP-2,3-diacylglucosamine pyrophosphatase LpxH
MHLGKLQVEENYILDLGEGKKYFIFHGDILDVFVAKWKWIAKIGASGYELALRINTIYNKYRAWRGLPYYSISKDIKNGIKKATNFINDFEDNAIRLTKQKGCDVAVCGHIHQPAMTDKYMNSGDWCENCTALAETKDGKWTLINYHK